MNSFYKTINLLRSNLAKWIQPPIQKDPLYLQRTLEEWLIYHHKEIIFGEVSWMGIQTQKNVLDMWIYQELLWDIQPDVIIEIGSLKGGSTLYFAHLLDIIGKGCVISIDINRDNYHISHDRVIALTGDSQSEKIINEVEKLMQGKTGLVIQDGNHEKGPVLKDLEVYQKFVTPGSYLIVEDSIVDIMQMKIDWPHIDGPLAAVKIFLNQNPHFEIDTTCERYLLGYNPKGYLKRIS